MGGLLHLAQRGGAWAGCGPAHPFLAVPNITTHPSTASVPITVLLYDGPLLYGFNVAIKGLNRPESIMKSRSQLRGLYAMTLSFGLSVRSFVAYDIC